MIATKGLVVFVIVVVVSFSTTMPVGMDDGKIIPDICSRRYYFWARNRSRVFYKIRVMRKIFVILIQL
jgi:hypothetical protein